MQEWIKELLVGAFNLIYPANEIWKTCMALVKAMLGITPVDIGGGDVWNRVVTEIYPPFLLIGSSLILIFLSIGFLKEITDFRKGITIEVLVTYGIRLILAEFLLVNAVPLIRLFFQMASQLSLTAFDDAVMSTVTPSDPQVGEMLTYLAWGLVYLIAALVSGFMILFAVYKRFLNLYLLTLFAPVALASMSGDRGICQTASAWVKSFLGSAFEIVVIALALSVSHWMIAGGLIVFTALEGTIAEWTVSVLEGLMTMTITAVTVKGAEGLLRRSFGL